MPRLQRALLLPATRRAARLPGRGQEEAEERAEEETRPAASLQRGWRRNARRLSADHHPIRSAVTRILHRMKYLSSTAQRRPYSVRPPCCATGNWADRCSIRTTSRKV